MKTKSEINYDYQTIEISQSRIDKGLIALPRSLTGWFPDHHTTIRVYLGDSPIPEVKNYTSYTGSTNESRIGGMADWFNANNIRGGDEIVIQLIDEKEGIYRLIAENDFIIKTKKLQDSFDNSQDEEEALEGVVQLAKWTELDKSRVSLNEYRRLVDTMPIRKREYVSRQSNQTRERAPHNLRVLLGEIYQGRCQVCDFTFLKKDDKPYFEIHHIDPVESHQPKNLMVVCANCHRQFQFANVDHIFNDESWLIKVNFNQSSYDINQILLNAKIEDFMKQTHV
jgi:hypothetical protein